MRAESSPSEPPNTSDISDYHRPRTELIAELRTLRAQVAAAEAIARASAASVANLSYELRTPLDVITGMTNLLLSTIMDTEQREYTETIQLSSQTLLDLISDALDLSRLETTGLELVKQPFQLADCLREACDLLATQAAQKELTLTWTIDPACPVWLMGDPLRIRQIVINLLRSAVKFTSHDVITIHAWTSLNTATPLPLHTTDSNPTGDATYRVHVRVQEQGSERMPPDHKYLCETFGQLYQLPVAQPDISLGLTLSKSLAELMSGTVWVERALGQETTFYATFLTTVDKQTPPAVEHHSPAPTALAQAEPSTVRILLVEDNNLNRQLLQRQLTLLGYTADAAANGQEAINALQKQPYDIILMDTQMPEMDGTQATHYIRTHWPPEQQPYIIAVTAYTLPEDGAKLLQLAADNYLGKPFQLEMLSQVLQQAVSAVTAPFDTTASAPSPATYLDAPVLDRTLLAELLTAGGGVGTAQAAMFLELYLNDIAQHITRLRDGLATDNRSELERTAHSLVSLAAQIGASRLSAYCRVLEQDTATLSPHQLVALLEEIALQFQQVQLALAHHTKIEE